jgi:hypothetical protein
MTFSELVRLLRREAIALHLAHLAELGLALPRRRRKPEIRIVARRRRVLLRGATRPLASRAEAAQSVCVRHGATRE